MSRVLPKFFYVVLPVAAVGAALLVALHLVKPSRHATEGTDDEVTAVVPTSRAEPQALGRAKLAITLPSDSGLTSVSFAVVSTEHIVVERGSALVDKQTGVGRPPAITLPSGKGYTVAVVGHSEVEGSRRSVYLGSGTFDVPAGHETPVSFTPNAGVDKATGESAGAAIPSGATGPVDNLAACQSCELSSDQGACATENITATSRTDPQTGDQTGVGWGCGTLADAKARSACLTLLHCLNVNGCGRPGENPVAGCYCGTAVPEQCIGGLGINGACIAAYQAAALVSPGGPGSGAGNGQLSQFIATASGDPTTPIGLADGIGLCATETHCDVCQAL